MEKKTRKIDINNIILPLFWAFILVLCVFILSTTSHAALPQSSSLPFLIDIENWSDSQGYSLQNLQDYYDNRWGSAYPCDFFSDDVLIYETNEFSNWYQTYIYYTIVYVPFDLNNYSYDINLNNTSYNAFDIDINYATFTMRGYNRIVFNSSRGYNDPQLFINETTSFNIFYNSNNEVTYISNNFNYFNDEDYPVLAIPIPSPIDIGIAIIPNFGNPNLDIDTNKPTIPTWDSVDNTTAPNFDSQNPLQSVFSIIEWGLKDPNGPFKVITNNTKKGFEYIGACIENLGKTIVENIQNAMTNLYENFVSLFEPINNNIIAIYGKLEEFANLFIHPFDEEEFEEQIENSSFFTNYHAIVDNCEVLTEIIDYAEERDHFSLYISFENPLDNSVHRIISSEISFDWLVPLRSIYRPFLWVCVLIELFVGGARVLTHALGGHGL